MAGGDGQAEHRPRRPARTAHGVDAEVGGEGGGVVGERSDRPVGLGELPPAPGRSTAISRTPARPRTSSSGWRARRESGVPWTYSTTGPAGSPTSSKHSRRPSARARVAASTPGSVGTGSEPAGRW